MFPRSTVEQDRCCAYGGICIKGSGVTEVTPLFLELPGFQKVFAGEGWRRPDGLSQDQKEITPDRDPFGTDQGLFLFGLDVQFHRQPLFLRCGCCPWFLILFFYSHASYLLYTILPKSGFFGVWVSGLCWHPGLGFRLIFYFISLRILPVHWYHPF